MSELIDSTQFEELREGCGEVFDEIYQELLELTPKLFDELESQINAGQAEEAGRTAHQIKGSVANFGFLAVREKMFAIEQTGKAGSLEGAAENLSNARRLFAETAEVVKARYGI